MIFNMRHVCKFCKLQTGVGLRRNYHQFQGTMKCLAIKGYANSVSELNYELESCCPTERDLKPDEALIKVHAASINPIDIVMSQGYGHNLINVLRRQSDVSEFPLILGRDYSGTIVKRGKKFRRFQEDEPVYGVRFVVGQGTHAEYVIANKHEIAPKPDNMDLIDAASLPYVACTTWYALIATGAVPVNGKCKRILIPGGSGGIGSFASQLCQAYGHDVITTCATDAVPLLTNLGLRHIIDYCSDTYEDDLRAAGPFDVILDTLNEKEINFFKQLLKVNMASQYVSLKPSLLPDTDSQGLALGLATAGSKFLQSNIDQLAEGKGLFAWGFFRPNALVLNNIRSLIEDGQIKAFVDRSFNIDNVLDAYLYAEGGHARGKTMITM